ncbi:MAG: type II toxin-antitoxin system VapC family toxin [Pseudomonadota bacterium]
MKRTYLDANILLEAFLGKDGAWVRAMEVLDDPERSLVVSDYLRLEVLPKPIFHNRRQEVEFMQTILENASERVSTSPALTGRAVDLAGRYDMSPLDALHVSAAVEAGVDELVTLEKSSKPMCRVTEVKVISLHSPPAPNAGPRPVP